MSAAPRARPPRAGTRARGPQRWLVAITLVAGSLLAASPAATADPANPSDAQIAQAQAAKQALAGQVGQLQAQAADLHSRLDQLRAASDAAIARYEQTTRDLGAALAAADQAAAALKAATAEVARARGVVQQLARDSFTHGISNQATALLFAPDPSQIDFSTAASTYLASRRDDALHAIEVATVTAANADSGRRAAVARADQLQRQADSQRATALESVQASQVQQQKLTASLADVNNQAATATAQLSGLLDQRAAYEAYQAELARQEAARQAKIQAEQAAAAAAAEQAARQAAAVPATGGGGAARGDQSNGIGAAAPAPPANGSWAAPLPAGSYSISTCYCARWGTFHPGLDLAAPLGTPIYAAGSGTVIAAGPASGFGNWVVIDHHDGTVSIYGHMRVLATTAGAQVGAGTLIAYVGNEGQSTGAHLHFEVRVGGISGPSTDPTVWLARRGVYL